MPPNRFESEVESFLEGSHGDRTHIKRADHPRLHHYAGRYSALIPVAVFSVHSLVGIMWIYKAGYNSEPSQNQSGTSEFCERIEEN